MSIAFILGAAEPPTAFPPNVWHAHEMAFGYGGAVVAGFLLTAIPNWTGRRVVRLIASSRKIAGQQSPPRD